MSETGPSDPQFAVPWSAPVGNPASPGAAPVGPMPPLGTAPVGYPPSPGTTPVAWTQPGYGLAPRKTGTDGFAIASLVLALVTAALPAIVLGIVALKRIRRDGTGGRGLAIAGIVLGSCVTPLVLAAVAIPVYLDQRQRAAEASAAASPGPSASSAENHATDGALDPASTAFLRLADLPTEVAGYVAPSIAAMDATARDGAAEGYGAVYSGSAGQVELRALAWTTADDADAWLSRYEASAPVDAVVDRAHVLGTDGQAIGRSVLVRANASATQCAMAWSNQTSTLMLAGPCAGVAKIFDNYPI